MRQNAGNRRPDRLKSAALGAGFALVPALAFAATPEPKTFRDWMAGCDNLKSCTALSLPAEAADPVAYLRLTRSAGPDMPVELTFRLRGDWKTPPRSVQLKLDGAPFPAGGKAMPAETDGDMLSLTFKPAEVTALVEAARKATKLSIAAPQVKAEISLSGSVAALLWIDEQQGRLNTTSALIRKGNGTNVPAAPALPVVIAKPASGALSEKDGKALAAALRKGIKQRDPDGCEDDETLLTIDEAWTLDSARSLVSLACSRGAYNVSNAFWMIERGDAKTAKPVVFPQGDGDAKNTLVNAGFDPKSGRINFFAKGRGIGDCGASGGYAWTGNAFVQTEFSMMGECRGIGSEDWITLYRSEIK